MAHDALVEGVRPNPPQPRAGRRARVGGDALVATACAATLAAALLTGCASAAGRAGGPPVPSPAPTSPASPTPDAHRLGDTVPASNGLNATALGYTLSTPDSAAAVEVQGCAAAGSVFGVSVSDGPWTLVFADGTASRASADPYPQLPQPRYPHLQLTLNPGDCARGWLVFPVPTGERPVVVRYQPPSSSPTDWSVG